MVSAQPALLWKLQKNRKVIMLKVTSISGMRYFQFTVKSIEIQRKLGFCSSKAIAIKHILL